MHHHVHIGGHRPRECDLCRRHQRRRFVIVANEGTKGHVIADAVVFIPVEKLAPGPTVRAKGPTPQEARKLRELEAQLKKLRSGL